MAEIRFKSRFDSTPTTTPFTLVSSPWEQSSKRKMENKIRKRNASKIKEAMMKMSDKDYSRIIRRALFNIVCQVTSIFVFWASASPVFPLSKPL
jgi:uncharacterized membrane protein YcgQ (UPF0703/DUF1980 family)